jgi:glutathione S-transferase
MRLFYSPTSPYVRKVSVVLQETGLADRVTLTPVAGNPLAPGTMPVDHNPLGKVPALVLDNGQVLFDSRVITRYLDALAKAGLYPEGEAVWAILTAEALADGILDAALAAVYETRLRPEEIRFAPWVEGQIAKINRALDAAERDHAPLLHGPLTMAQIALGVALGYVDFRLAHLEWRATRPHLAAWEAEFGQRPAMLATRPVG